MFWSIKNSFKLEVNLSESMFMAQNPLWVDITFPILCLRQAVEKKKNKSRIARTTHQSDLLRYLESVVRLLATPVRSVDKYSARV